jgi:hypothetical protein
MTTSFATQYRLASTFLWCACVGLVCPVLRAVDVDTPSPSSSPSEQVAQEEEASTSTVPRPPETPPAQQPPAKPTPAQPASAGGLTRLDPQAEVWVDAERRRVVVGGQICLREGLLEMFACPKGTKEHESIVSVNARAYMVHAALLAIGAKAGQPVQYDPVYRAATGDQIVVEILWRDEAGKVVRRRAQDLVRNVKTRTPMEHEWVFAGSGFWQDEGTDERYYQAEGGELICLSNFSTATLDLTVESPRDNAALLYEALTENVPPLGTPVRLVLSAINPPTER